MMLSYASSRHHSTGTKIKMNNNIDEVVENGDYLCNNRSSSSCSEDYSDSSVLLPPPHLHRQRGDCFNVDDDDCVGYAAVNRKTTYTVNMMPPPPSSVITSRYIHINSCRGSDDERQQQPSPRATFDHPSTFSRRAFTTTGSSEEELRSESLLPSVADKMMGACECSWEMLNDLLRTRR